MGSSSSQSSSSSSSTVNSSSQPLFRICDETGEKNKFYKYDSFPLDLFGDIIFSKITRFQLLKRGLSNSSNMYNHWALLFELDEKVLFVAEYESGGVNLGFFKKDYWYSAYSFIVGADDYVYFRDLPLDIIKDYYDMTFTTLILHIEFTSILKEYNSSKYNVLSKSCQTFCQEILKKYLPDDWLHILFGEVEQTVVTTGRALTNPLGLLLDKTIFNESWDYLLGTGRLKLDKNTNGIKLDTVAELL